MSDLSILKTNKGLTSAFFSPDGNKVVQTCNDDCLRIYDSSDVADPKREWLLLNFAADRLCTVYSSRTEFGTSPKSAATLIFCPQRIHKNYFQLRETYQNGTFEGMGVGFGNCSYVKVGRGIHHSKIWQSSDVGYGCNSIILRTFTNSLWPLPIIVFCYRCSRFLPAVR